MGPRKRNVASAKDQQTTTEEKSPKSAKQSAKCRESDGETGYAGVFLIIMLILVIAASTYIYIFIDMRPILEYFKMKPMRTESEIHLLNDNPPEANVHGTADTDTSSVNKKIVYSKADITNPADNKIRSELDAADSLIDKRRYQDAMNKYDNLLMKYPKSPRAVYGKALALDKKAEAEKSNQLLEQAIDQYLKVLDLPDVPKSLMVQAGKTGADRQTFRGWGFKATKTLQLLIDVYPDDVGLWNALGVKYLMIHRNDEARSAFKQSLAKAPEDGFAKVHYGFIVKSIDHKYADAIPFLREGINTNDSGVIDGRFFFHLGDALHRIGKPEEAFEVYESGAQHGVFMSKWQRSLYNVDGLTARPWWTHQQTGHAKFLKMLEDNWQTIRDEGLAQMDPKTGSFVLEDEDLREAGDWKQFTLYVQGRKNQKNCAKAPKTCAIVDQFPDVAKCRRGQVKFSVMQPGVHVWPHCGPTNCRLRSHIGLVVPDGVRIRVTEETRGWQEGKAFVFDDSFEHEVWHDGDSYRLVLISDMWHPGLTPNNKRTLPAI